ncbi:MULTISPECIES: hypothetical protein [unclassified Roseovarius]|uniref:hypothetical protein n=1 Tax=unclassified Roseovarius TaxID=2614913 RepID=UPI00273DDA1E|nr:MULTISPECIES: hypothetical protein [unclassified Roseovarius]
MNAAVTNRRQMLLGLAAASTAAATVTEASIAENPDLIRMGNELPAIEAEHVAARAEVKRIISKYSPTWPRAPKAIVRYGTGCLKEQTIDFRGYPHDIKGCGAIRVGTPEVFRREAEYDEGEIARILKTKSKRRLGMVQKSLEENRAAIPIARKYWAEVDAIRDASGIEAALERRSETRERLTEQVNAILECEERSMQGVLIKAQALVAFNSVEPFYRFFESRSKEWGNQIASAIFRQASQERG